MKKANVEPSPFSEWTPMAPPCNFVSDLEMKRPRPEPPYLTCVRGVACEKREKSFFCSSVVIPQPVSLTFSQRNAIRPSPHSALSVTSFLGFSSSVKVISFQHLGGRVQEPPMVTVMAFWGRSLVNLMALVLFVLMKCMEIEDEITHSRLISTCSKRDGSSIVQSMPLKVSSMRKASLMPAWLHSTSNMRTASDTTNAGCTRVGVIKIKLESSFDKVSTSSITRFWCIEHDTMISSDSMQL